MQIQRYVPPPDHPLAPYVQSIWRIRFPKSQAVETILPKGNVDLLFNLGDAHQTTGLANITQTLSKQSAYVAGLQTHSFLSHHMGELAMIGVSLRVETCAALLPLPSAELTDCVVEGQLVLPGMDEILARLAALDDFTQQRNLLLAWVGAQLAQDRTIRMVDAICRALHAAPQAQTLDAVSQTHGISARHLRRLFHQRLGLSPSHYLRLSRFAQALHLMNDATANLTAIAHHVGYFDQAHFCRDFKHIAGMTPGEYRKGAAPAPGHLFE